MSSSSGLFPDHREIATEFAKFKHELPAGLDEVFGMMAQTTPSKADLSTYDKKYSVLNLRAQQGDKRAIRELVANHVEDDLTPREVTISELRDLLDQEAL